MNNQTIARRRARLASAPPLLALLLLLPGCLTTGDTKPPDGASGPAQASASAAAAAPAAAPAPVPAPPSASPAPAQAPPSPPTPIPVLPHPQAVQTAVDALFGKADLPPPEGGNGRHVVVIDPLIDGMTRVRTEATRVMEANLTRQVRDKYPAFEIRPLSASELARSPLLIVGTFTPVNMQGKTEGMREIFRFCLAMVDLKTGKVVSKTVARSRMEGVDHTPQPYFRDAPAWSRDPATENYVKTCQASKAGDMANPGYLESLVTGALVDEGIRAYNAGRHKDALAIFVRARQTPAGAQLRVFNGLYLSSWKLNRRDAIADHFGRLVDYGFDQGHLAVTFLFRPGASILPPDGKQGPYGIWLKTIAQRADQRRACVEVAGHTSGGGPEVVNERLSALRAEHVRQRLVETAPRLAKRVIATGYGSREMLIGTGRDDASDQLDRRVDFKLLPCAS